MNSQPDHPDFSTVLTTTNATTLLNRLIELEDTSNFGSSYTNLTVGNKKLDAVAKTKLDSYLKISQQQWQWLNDVNTDNKIKNTLINTLSLQKNSEYALTDWLISLFNALFLGQQVELIRGEQEPEYFPTQGDKPARIVFAHGFFASALHEISHWCIAGSERRLLNDFGYWYAPDGRTAAQQQAFESAEVKPQALECLFTLACGRPFQVSQDNLFASFDTSASTFSHDVYQQVVQYIAVPQSLPRDAKTLLRTLLIINTTKSI